MTTFAEAMNPDFCGEKTLAMLKQEYEYDPEQDEEMCQLAELRMHIDEAESAYTLGQDALAREHLKQAAKLLDSMGIQF